MAVLSHQVNFRFHTQAVGKAHGRYIKGEFGRYKINPNIIAIDVHENDAATFTTSGMGEIVTGKISNGTPGYKALNA